MLEKEILWKLRNKLGGDNIEQIIRQESIIFLTGILLKTEFGKLGILYNDVGKNAIGELQWLSFLICMSTFVISIW